MKLKQFFQDKWLDLIFYAAEFIGVSVIITFVKNHFDFTTITLASTVVILITIILRHRKRYKIFPNLEWDYVHNRANYAIEFKSRESLCCYRKLSIKAIKKGVKEFTGEYIWTGNEVKKIDISLNNRKINRVVYDAGSKENYELHDKYKIELIDHMGINEEVDCDISFELKDTECCMEPFFQVAIVRPTTELALELRAPEQMVKTVTMEIKTKHGDKDLILREPLLPNTVVNGKRKTIVYRYNVPKEHIKLLYNYEMKWQFCDKRKKPKKS